MYVWIILAFYLSNHFYVGIGYATFQQLMCWAPICSLGNSVRPIQSQKTYCEVAWWQSFTVPEMCPQASERFRYVCGHFMILLQPYGVGVRKLILLHSRRTLLTFAGLTTDDKKINVQLQWTFDNCSTSSDGLLNIIANKAFAAHF